MAVGKKLRWEIFRRDNFACRYCGRSINDGAILEVDHVNPRSRRGADVPTNLVTACDACNSGKSDTPLNAPPVEDVPQALFRRACAERGVTPPSPAPVDPDGMPQGLANKILYFLTPAERDLMVEEDAFWHIPDDEEDEDNEIDLNDPDCRERLALRAFTDERSDRLDLELALEQIIRHLPAEHRQLVDAACQDFVRRRQENGAPTPRASLILAIAAGSLADHLNREVFRRLPDAEQAEWLEYAEALWPAPFDGSWEVDEDCRIRRAAQIVTVIGAGRIYPEMCTFPGQSISHCPKPAEDRIYIDDCDHCDDAAVPDGGHPSCRWHTEAFRAGRMTRLSDGASPSLRDVQPFSSNSKELA